MALTPQNDVAFIREVDEELRREQVATLWRRHGRNLAIVIVLALALFAGFLWWQHHRAEQTGEAAEQLVGALTDVGEHKDAQANAALAKLTTSSSTSYATTAKMAVAALALEKGDTKAAIAGFKAVADDTSVPQPFRDIALIRQTAAEFDTLPPEQVVARLKPMAVAGNPWFGSAGELTATALLRMNRTKEAAAMFAAMTRDRNVPESLRLRASKVASGYGVEGLEPQQADAAAGPALPE